MIRLPAHINEKVSRLYRVSIELSHRLGRDPEDEELARELGWSVEEVSFVQQVMPDAGSLDEPMRGSGAGESGSELISVLEDATQTAEPEESLLRACQASQIRVLLDRLPERQAQAIIAHHGLDGEPPKTFAQLAAELGTTRQSTRNLYNKARKSLRELMGGEREPGVSGRRTGATEEPVDHRQAS